MDKKYVENIASSIFEVTGNIINDKVLINIDSLPDINFIERKIMLYCEKDNVLLNFFFEKISEKKMKYLYTRLPKDILDYILNMTIRIKKYILNVIYNHWHRYFIDILNRIKEDYELYADWTYDYENNIFFILQEKMEEVNSKFDSILLCVNK